MIITYPMICDKFINLTLMTAVARSLEKYIIVQHVDLIQAYVNRRSKDIVRGRKKLLQKQSQEIQKQYYSENGFFGYFDGDIIREIENTINEKPDFLNEDIDSHLLDGVEQATQRLSDLRAEYDNVLDKISQLPVPQDIEYDIDNLKRRNDGVTTDLDQVQDMIVNLKSSGTPTTIQDYDLKINKLEAVRDRLVTEKNTLYMDITGLEAKKSSLEANQQTLQQQEVKIHGDIKIATDNYNIIVGELKKAKIDVKNINDQRATIIAGIDKRKEDVTRFRKKVVEERQQARAETKKEFSEIKRKYYLDRFKDYLKDKKHIDEKEKLERKHQNLEAREKRAGQLKTFLTKRQAQDEKEKLERKYQDREAREKINSNINIFIKKQDLQQQYRDKAEQLDKKIENEKDKIRTRELKAHEREIRQIEKQRQLQYDKMMQGLQREKDILDTQVAKETGTIRVGKIAGEGINIEPTWTTVETPTGSQIIGVKVLPIYVSGNIAISELLKKDRYIKSKVDYVLRKHIRTFAKFLLGKYNLAFERFLRKNVKTKTLSKNPVKDIILNQSPYKDMVDTTRSRIFVCTAIERVGQNFLTNYNDLRKMFKLGWNGIILTDDSKQHVYFIFPENRGLYTVVPYTHMFYQLGKSHGQVYEKEQELKSQTQALFKVKGSFLQYLKRYFTEQELIRGSMMETKYEYKDTIKDLLTEGDGTLENIAKTLKENTKDLFRNPFLFISSLVSSAKKGDINKIRSILPDIKEQKLKKVSDMMDKKVAKILPTYNAQKKLAYSVISNSIKGLPRDISELAAAAVVIMNSAQNQDTPSKNDAELRKTLIKLVRTHDTITQKISAKIELSDETKSIVMIAAFGLACLVVVGGIFVYFGVMFTQHPLAAIGIGFLYIVTIFCMSRSPTINNY